MCLNDSTDDGCGGAYYTPSIIDAVVPGPGEQHFSKFLDLEMLMLPGGKERTAEEFESLLDKSGFKLNRIIPTPSPVSIVEAVKA